MSPVCSPRLVSVSGMFWLSSDHCPAIVGRNMNTSRLIGRVVVGGDAGRILVGQYCMDRYRMPPGYNLLNLPVSPVVRFEPNTRLGR